ncbi:Lysophospholipid acyltransferase lpeat2 [Stylosanthes scabra]|uniref:Lysophospholipid acyltransferase lpeat2 n=1 Tax=Stylosanthes scabra TaxID=79078 RepID=A0ABU6VH61_9FABA|nr:Lysophospholipid acyltransferase lpeat2 [Stylosanthes scabra]
MPNHDITSPLITSDHLILTVDPPPTSDTTSTTPFTAGGNPFTFLGCDENEALTIPAPMTVDPFKNNTPNIEGFYEWLKMLVCLPIAILRLVLFGLCLAVGYIATRLALEGWKDKENPMPKWRCRLMGIDVALDYQWIKRKGRPAPREVAPIIVSNHVSYIEPIFYFYELFPTIVASESHDALPFVGTIIRAMQVIYVDRFSPSSRKHAVKEIKRRASCNRFPRVLLFPEGTTTNGRNLISFQLGAFIPGYPIQPVIVRYPHVHFDQSWGNVSLGKLMFRMFTQFHNFFEVEYLPVISPLHDKETAVHFRERATRAIASAMNVVQTGHTYGDIMLYMKAQEAKQENPSSYMVEMARVESLFHIRSLEAVEFLDKFLAMNPDPSGRVQYHDFLKVLRLKACPLSEKIFAFIDVEKCGTITFRQFLYGSAYVMKHRGFHQACEEAFAECSDAVKGYIVEQKLQDFMQQAIPSWNENEVHELFMLFDEDDDGRITKDDFHSCLKKNPLLIAFLTPHLQHKECGGNNGVLEIV